MSSVGKTTRRASSPSQHARCIQALPARFVLLACFSVCYCAIACVCSMCVACMSSCHLHFSLRSFHLQTFEYGHAAHASATNHHQAPYNPRHPPHAPIVTLPTSPVRWHAHWTRIARVFPPWLAHLSPRHWRAWVPVTDKACSVRCPQVVQEYERAVIFRLGRLLSGGAKGPGR